MINLASSEFCMIHELSFFPTLLDLFLKIFPLRFLFFGCLLDLFAKYCASQFGKGLFVVVFIVVFTICRAITQHKKISTSF